VSSPSAAAGHSSTRPFIVAHRAGNRHDSIREATRHAGLVVEADLRLANDRLEARHMRCAGPLPLLWDRWELAAGWRPRPTVLDVLDRVPPATPLLLDLKGSSPRIAELAREAIAPEAGRREITVCARSWPLLDAFTDLPVARVASVGSRRQLRALVQRFPRGSLDGVSIHERLLDRVAVRRLREVCGLIMTWPVNTVERATELVALGVEGLISDEPAQILRGLGLSTA
jgi:glycerophosphoryl diester phosphodiesterase